MEVSRMTTPGSNQKTSKASEGRSDIMQQIKIKPGNNSGIEGNQDKELIRARGTNGLEM